MAQTGDPNEAFLADVARARSTDGSVAGGLERVVRMAQTAALVHEADSLGAIRPDLLDEDPEYKAAVQARRKARVVAALIRPTGPVRRLSKVGVVVRREQLGLG